MTERGRRSIEEIIDEANKTLALHSMLEKIKQQARETYTQELYIISYSATGPMMIHTESNNAIAPFDGLCNKQTYQEQLTYELLKNRIDEQIEKYINLLPIDMHDENYRITQEALQNIRTYKTSVRIDTTKNSAVTIVPVVITPTGNYMICIKKNEKIRLPQGIGEDGDTAMEMTAYRELFEETNVQNVNLTAITPIPSSQRTYLYTYKQNANHYIITEKQADVCMALLQTPSIHNLYRGDTDPTEDITNVYLLPFPKENSGINTNKQKTYELTQNGIEEIDPNTLPQQHPSMQKILTSTPLP